MNIAAPFPRLALIAGPSASGKSAMAIALAELAGGVVVNADASQVYRDLRVITARPSPEDEARVPHRLFGYVDGADACSAARWAADARAAVAQVHAAGRLPILVGGTGLYIRTLLDGIAPVPQIDPQIRAEARALAVGQAHAALATEDPAAAARLSGSDTTRIARALEVVRSTGRPLAHWQRERSGGIGAHVTLAPLILLPDRADLFARCDARLAAMFDGGAIAEVAALRARTDVPADAAIRGAIGVRDIAAFLAGTATRDEALASARAATRRYVKRQYTWFRHQPAPEWPIVTQLNYNMQFLKEIFLFLA